MILIGVTGFLRSGKNEVAAILQRHFGFQVYGFADALREMALAVDPMISLEGTPETCPLPASLGWRMCRYSDLLEAVGYDQAKAVPDCRRFLQRLGTEGVRGTFGPKAWVAALADRIAEDNDLQHAGSGRVHCAVVADVRFHSEADWIHSQHGRLWGVHRLPPHPEATSALHASEKDIPNLPADRHIDNYGSLDDLERAVVAAALEDFPTLANSTD